MKKFHEEMAQYNQQHCSICKKLWPSKDPLSQNFSLQNEMIRDLFSVPNAILRDFYDQTMVEEMILSHVLPIMRRLTIEKWW